MGIVYTNLRIENMTTLQLQISLIYYDIYIFDDSVQKLDSLIVKKNSSKERVIKMLRGSDIKNAVVLRLTYTDGSKDQFRINLKCVHANVSPDFVKFREDHSLSYRKEGNTIIITIQHTPKQLEEQRAKDLMSEAELLIHQGETLIQKALEAENDSDTDRSEEALKYYQEARDLFEEANLISPSWDFRRNLAQVENKIEGDKLFNFAIELDIKATELLESNNSEEAEEQFSLILTVLNDAKNKFQESGELGQQGIDDVQDFQKLIEERSFELALSKIQFKSRTNDNEMNYQENFEAEMITLM